MSPTEARGLSRVRVLIAEDEPLVRAALAELIQQDSTLELVGVAKDATQAIELASAIHPDVALLDVKMPGGGGPVAARGISLCAPQTRVVALSAYDDRTSVLEMLRAGAVGYLVKGAAPDLADSIRRSARGQGTLSAAVTADVIKELTTQLDEQDRLARWRDVQKEQIRLALQGRGLRMVFQPIFELRTGRVAGMEALARFEAEPHRPPEVWLDEARSVGLLRDLEMAAVRLAFAEIDRIACDAFLSVNVSPATAASGEFLESVCAVPGDRLVLEVTEHARVDDYDELTAALRALRDCGARLAIDDAGAGFASLQHIVRLAPDFIKLDITLTHRIDADPIRRALATALISFASDTGAAIIAEGIENQAEFDVLQTLGASYGQGYYLARPAPLAADDMAGGERIVRSMQNGSGPAGG
jgi:EAL domain-containing protein (putative c-di-GMP-specific phosphodiesterase class I)/AmiR/NasT family two-component response regulator